MGVKKVYAEKNNFLYGARKHDFIYLFAEDFCTDEDGLIYVELDSLYYTSFKDIVVSFKESLPTVIPISVIGDGSTASSFIFHFEWATRPFVLETISKFEARELKEAFEEHIIIDDVEVEYIKYTDDIFGDYKKNPSVKNRKREWKIRYQFFLTKEMESVKNKMVAQQDFLGAKKLEIKLSKRKRKLEKIKIKKIITS